MKLTYEAPRLDVELFQLNQSIALNCAITLNKGPDDECSDWEDRTTFSSRMKVATMEIQVTDNSECDCYNTLTDTFFTS